MKQSILLATTMAIVAVASTEAQNIVDAARYGSSSIVGTARYRSMAGAFGALGGDPTCMNDNPAGIAIYRNNTTFSITPHFSYTSTESKGAEKFTSNDNNFAVSDLSIILPFRIDEGNLVNFNLGFGFTRRYENHNKMNLAMESTLGTFGEYLTNQANNYLGGTQSPKVAFDLENNGTLAPFMSMMAYDCYAIVDNPKDKHSVIDPNAVLPNYTQNLYMRESTREDHYNLSASVNINDMLFLGATMVISDYNSTLTSEFSEEYSSDYFTYYDNRFETKGSGVGLNLGVLWNPVDNLRLGAAIHTPTWYTMDCYCEGAMTTDRCIDYDYWSTYDDNWRFDFYTPWEYQLSAAYVIGTKALVSLEYDLRDYKTMKYTSEGGNGYDGGYDKYNDLMKDCLKMQHTIKAGAEYRLTDQLSIRGGYAYVTSPFTEETLNGSIDNHNAVYYETSKPNSSNLGTQYYVTGGLGWRSGSWTIDCSYMYHHSKYHVIAYPGDFSGYHAIEVNQGKQDFDITFGYRF